MNAVTQKESPIQNTSSRSMRLSPLVAIPLLSLLLLFSLFLATSFGSTAIPISQIAQILINGIGLWHFQPTWDQSIENIIWNVRLPVVVGAALVGAALATAGVLFQGMLRNPLADPFLIGTSSGASLGAAISFILPIGFLTLSFSSLTPILAFGGAILTVLLVYSLSRIGDRTPVVTLLLAGVVINSIMVACQTLILTLAPQQRFTGQVLFNWLSGGIAVNDWLSVQIVGALILIGIVLAMGFGNVLDALALGEEGAAFLGLDVERAKLLIVLVASLITAAAVSISGLVGFVGLVTPHIMRLLLGPRHRLLIPVSALGGAIFLILADLLARVAFAPAVLPVGVFTALVGAPFFLVLLRNSKREYRW
jgi:iron complex transport system permease protein